MYYRRFWTAYVSGDAERRTPRRDGEVEAALAASAASFPFLDPESSGSLCFSGWTSIPPIYIYNVSALVVDQGQAQ